MNIAFQQGRILYNADVIVTGDADLLVLNPFREVEIITPEIFVSRFKGIN